MHGKGIWIGGKRNKMVQEKLGERASVLENSFAKLVWDFEFNLQKTATSRRPDLVMEDTERNKIWICDMTCPRQANVATAHI